MSERRERRRSSARRRAEMHKSGFQTTTISLPDGVSFWTCKPGVHSIDILPFVPKPSNPYFDPKYPEDLHYERTYYQYWKLGVEEKSYVCLAKLGLRDPVHDWKKAHQNDPRLDPEYLKSLNPRQRQLFWVHDHAQPGKLFLWEFSFACFGKLLDSRINNSPEDSGWDEFYFADDAGSTLRLTAQESSGGTFSFTEVTAIDFIPRRKGQHVPKEIMDQVTCLDDLLVIPSYDELKSIFLGGDPMGHEEDVPASQSQGAYSMDPPEQDSRPTQQPDKPAEATEPAEKPNTRSKKETQQRATEAPVSEKAATMPKASDFGIKKGIEVHYQGKPCLVLKVSGDGTSLTLSDPDDEIITAVAPEDVVVGGESASAEEPKAEQPPFDTDDTAKEPPKDVASSFDDDDWQF